MNKKTYGEKIFEIINVFLLLLLALLAIYPFWHTLVLSVSSYADSLRGGYYLWPTSFVTKAYKDICSDSLLWVSYANTIVRTFVGTVLGVLVTAAVAYPLSRKTLPFRKALITYVMFTMIFHGGMIPTYLLIRTLNLVNNRWVYILPQLISAYNTIVIKSYFESLPESLIESAKIEGCSEFRIFRSIMLPLSKPVLATVALFIGVGHWNSWFDSMIYFTDTNKQVVQLYLQHVINSSTIDTGSLMTEGMEMVGSKTTTAATIVVTVVPMLCVYPFIQKYFTKGITLGAVKG